MPDYIVNPTEKDLSARISLESGTVIFRAEQLKQEQIVIERSARLNLEPGRGDKGDRGDG